MPMSLQEESTVPEAWTTVEQYTLNNHHGMQVTIANRGATITGIWVPDARGQRANVVLSYGSPESYRSDRYYLGCTVGRYANRIANGQLSIQGERYALPINEKVLHNHLHGGEGGFHKKIWAFKSAATSEGWSWVELSCTSPHLEEGYPGRVQVDVRYGLSTNHNELHLWYSARTDRATVVNITNHSYFNLSGGKRPVTDHQLAIHAADYTPLNERYLPTGAVQAVAGSPYDLRTPVRVGDVTGLIPTANYCLDYLTGLTPAATLTDPESRRRLTVQTTAPGLQLYCGNFLGPPFHPFAGLCLEPQYYPDAPNHPHFPSPLLLPTQTYRQTIVYTFDCLPY